MRRTCPRDRAPLEARETRQGLRSLVVDECASCRGVFLDRGEMRRVVPERAVVAYFTRVFPDTRSSPCICPGCGGLMRAKGEEAVAHVCETCEGVWLDAADLAKLESMPAEALPDESREERAAREAEKFRRRTTREEPDPLPILFFGGIWGFLYLLLRERRR